ncbi:alkaline phosphatase family protein [Nocardioides sp. dk4132]|uniref:alkaline phosphatase family protein n=1 Tax=unclassified Nocardioides TaxID=2615069 RepID=UPI001295F29C|nr:MULTISPECIES: nucleotide pyrophosphatase/phosphodiesterase family protein [unclassified Nocardioides]MQW74983.1 alkaline phosphatase family protein [Nocardioides sp. dk4132]QGA07834.1 alkaline phosphatase family protein [Nocardioides sp. dk884]
MDKLLVADVVGLTPDLLQHMPRLRRLADTGSSAALDPLLPAVTCSMQSTFLTGLPPAGHGIVGNGWFFRDLGEVFLWRQHNRLVQGEKVWETIRRHVPGYTVANVCWWYAMGASTDWTVTPRPIYYADGKKAPDFYARPPQLHHELREELGEFPLFQYWGPTASLRSTEWIVGAARRLMPRADLTLAYLPHLDYDLQRYGPGTPEATRAAADVDRALAPLLDDAERCGARVVVLSEYGITRADTPVDVNRVLRAEGLLEVYTQDEMEYLDPWASRAFAVADHQVAHVYVADPADLERVRAVCAGLPGVAEVLDRGGQAQVGLDHERAGELVLVAEPTAWFTYYYWDDDDRAPDFARGVEIHRKPGYDPAELFFDPADRLVKARAALTLARKTVGLRYAMKVVPLDPAPVRGTHGRLPLRDEEGPMVLCDRPGVLGERLAATGVRDLLLDLVGVGSTAPVA